MRTTEAPACEIARGGHATAVISPHQFVAVSCPGYAEIRLDVRW